MSDPYQPIPANTGKRNAVISFPISLWDEIKDAAAWAEISAAEWVRRACQEKLGDQQ